MVDGEREAPRTMDEEPRKQGPRTGEWALKGVCKCMEEGLDPPKRQQKNKERNGNEKKKAD